jgi:hypothetical protein
LHFFIRREESFDCLRLSFEVFDQIVRVVHWDL